MVKRSNKKKVKVNKIKVKKIVNNVVNKVVNNPPQKNELEEIL